jgi:hypothetical protein
MRSSWIGSIVSTLIMLLITLGLLELLSFGLSRGGMLLFNDPPTWYLKDQSQVVGPASDGRGVRWRSESADWGAWHKPNVVDEHVQSCFNVTYATNEVGARDDSFTGLAGAEDRFILLGDSFAEGYGSTKEQTAEVLLENTLGLDLLNFGSAMGFGPVQYKLIYEKLARHYPHEGIVLFFLPSNDFDDNDPNDIKMTGGTNSKPRWRPYYRKREDGSFDIFYPEGAEKREEWVPSGFAHQLKSVASRYLWSFNTWLTAEHIIESSKKKNTRRRSYSGYFDATEEQQQAAVYFIDQILALAEGRSLLLVVIPRQEDFDRIDAGARVADQWWYQQFSARQASLPLFRLLDLSAHRDAPVNDLFLTCDGHWSVLGNVWAARHVAPVLEELDALNEAERP